MWGQIVAPFLALKRVQQDFCQSDVDWAKPAGKCKKTVARKSPCYFLCGLLNVSPRDVRHLLLSTGGTSSCRPRGAARLTK